MAMRGAESERMHVEQIRIKYLEYRASAIRNWRVAAACSLRSPCLFDE